MCGLFGMVRSPFADDPGRASDVLVTLGALAEERGAGAAGLALLGAWPGLGGCRVVRGRGRFTAVWHPDLLPELDRAPVVLGHTRRTTQSPPAAVIGDIDGFAPPASGTTDNEPLFRRLAGCASPAEVTGVLEAAVGRAALAWARRDRPTEVHLARAALSPLTVAVDTDQNLYWASDPEWFRAAARHTRTEFATAVLLREGTYLKIGMEPRPGRRDRPDILTAAAFTPATQRRQATQTPAAPLVPVP